MSLSTTATAAREALAPGSENGFSSDTIWSAVSAKARLALSIIIGNNRLNRGDSTGDEEGTHQPGRGVPDARLGPAPAEVTAASAAASSRRAPEASIPGGKPARGSGDPDSADPSAPSSSAVSFRSRIHDSFMATFAQRMLDDCGVAVIDMSLEDVRITDPVLAEAMARGAVARADLAKATIEKQILVTKSRAEKEAAIVRAEGTASSTQIIAASEAARVKLMDETFSRAVSQLTAQREAILAAGEVLKGTNSSVFFAASPSDLAGVMGARALESSGLLRRGAGASP
jgi:hypothetical protein